MEFLETHTGKDAKAVWKNDIDVPVKEESIEESDDESDDEFEDQEDDESKKNGEKKKNIFFLSCFFYFLWIIYY